MKFQRTTTLLLILKLVIYIYNLIVTSNFIKISSIASGNNLRILALNQSIGIINYIIVTIDLCENSFWSDELLQFGSTIKEYIEILVNKRI